jgi:hypothetical protein
MSEYKPYLGEFDLQAIEDRIEELKTCKRDRKAEIYQFFTLADFPRLIADLRAARKEITRLNEKPFDYPESLAAEALAAQKEETQSLLEIDADEH